MNGSAGAFGISGTSYASAFSPGANGSLTQLQPVGPCSPNSGTTVYNPDYTTFLPGAGLSWAPGKNNKTAIRVGYASNPGMNTTLSFTSGGALNLSNVALPYSPGQALATVALTDLTRLRHRATK